MQGSQVQNNKLCLIELRLFHLLQIGWNIRPAPVHSPTLDCPPSSSSAQQFHSLENTSGPSIAAALAFLQPFPRTSKASLPAPLRRDLGVTKVTCLLQHNCYISNPSVQALAVIHQLREGTLPFLAESLATTKFIFDGGGDHFPEGNDPPRT